MKITLCVICGNESHHIERMLESFGLAFDELALVRASGAAIEDDTEPKAAAWCDANGKTYLGSKYRNAPDAAKWEHVDDFSAARNAAFALARGAWLFWADCDDLCADAGALRRAMDETPEAVQMLRFPYDVQGTSKIPHRERCVRRAAWEAGARWMHPVHENLVPPGGMPAADHPSPAWIHSPHQITLANRKRNLRILGRALKDAPMNFFYLHQEHYCAGNKNSAEGIGDLVVQLPNLDDAFKVEAYLNIARITTDRDKAQESALTAHSKLPWCREPIAALVMLAFERNDARRALHWAKLLHATPEPVGVQRPWTHEPKWYGYAADDILARAYRLSGDTMQAQAAQDKFHHYHEPRITLCHATRGRTMQALQARDAWLAAADCPHHIEHIFAVDSDDKECVQMAKQFVSVTSDKKTCVAAWNLAAEKARGGILVQLSDDWIPFVGWDSAILAAAGTRYPAFDSFVVAISDGTRKDDLLCMAILSRARWEKQGREMFSAEYESMYSDNEFSVRAFADGVVIDARQSITFRHLHPVFGSAHNDATYAHTNHPDRYASGLETFQRRNPAIAPKRMPRFTQAEITMSDEFGQALVKYSTGTKCALEIGGGFGDGSTQCIKSDEIYSVENHPTNIPMHEAALSKRDGGHPIASNATDPEKWMTSDDVTAFYRGTPTRLNQYPLAMVLSWLDEDREIAKGHRVCGFKENTHPRFDFVLIDGCPFSAQSELAAMRHRLLPGAFVALDDVVDIKNWANYHALKSEPGVRLVWENLSLRNGAAIFQLPT